MADEQKNRRWLELLLQGIALFIAIVIPIVSATQSEFKELDTQINEINERVSYILGPDKTSIRLNPEYYTVRKEIAIIRERLDTQDKSIQSLNSIIRDYFVDKNISGGR